MSREDLTALMAQILASAAISLVTMLPLPTQAQTFKAAVAAYERGDYATALAGFRFHAEQGDAYAQYNLGLMYANGKGGSLRMTLRRCDGIASPPGRAMPTRSTISGSCTPTARGSQKIL